MQPCPRNLLKLQYLLYTQTVNIYYLLHFLKFFPHILFDSCFFFSFLFHSRSHLASFYNFQPLQRKLPTILPDRISIELFILQNSSRMYSKKGVIPTHHLDVKSRSIIEHFLNYSSITPLLPIKSSSTLQSEF